MLKQLLIPLDRSPLAEQAVGRAAALARATDASVDLVLVHEPFGTPLGVGLEGYVDDLADEQRYLEDVANELRSLIGDIRKDPKKYLNVRVSIF